VLAARIADRIALLDGSQVLTVGPVAEVVASANPIVREFLDGGLAG